MGIALHPGNLRMSYSGFNALRRDISNLFGVNLGTMKGFGGSAEWNTFPEQGLVPLLNHSDCDGELSVADMKLIVPCLKPCVDKLIEYHRSYCQTLIDDMESAISNNKKIDFH